MCSILEHLPKEVHNLLETSKASGSQKNTHLKSDWFCEGCWGSIDRPCFLWHRSLVAIGHGAFDQLEKPDLVLLSFCVCRFSCTGIFCARNFSLAVSWRTTDHRSDKICSYSGSGYICVGHEMAVQNWPPRKSQAIEVRHSDHSDYLPYTGI